jgi:LmbE family N-acetylglucosaminyl deacetylase
VEAERVLVITAHPDDVDFGVAGSVAAWTDQGVDVAYCVVTDGDAGGFDPTVPRSDIPGIRRAEQEAAAKIVGVEQVYFLGHPDGRLYPTIELRRDLSRVIRQFRPGRVVCQSAERLLDRIYASHPDHLAAGEAALCAVYPDARNPFAFPELLQDEGLEPWTVHELWLMGPGDRSAAIAVETTATVDRKVTALLCHESQIPDREGLTKRVLEAARSQGEMAGLPAGSSAELYRVTLIP